MCTYETATLPISGAGKGRDGWFPLTDATVYFDHPVAAPQSHTLNVDFRNPGLGAAARVAVELDPAAARALAENILAMLDAAPPALLEESLA
ncbi:DUF6295 family protein [Cryptosporangium phraense]|uniref:Uncharacterized protein n=1 Tax=Cryptosporangium phraense TaxID=2593070 RepID=A0A545AL90_9ACTN|nr:DUF6295 family protein [Cryptosporangium phraense]TQS42088.1 hypothetical protein FL583_26235 [Cryptosporangium phraense]